MAKDDYEVIVYRLLVYLYACMKRKIIYEDATFRAAVRKNVENDGYFYDILRMARDEDLIENVRFTKAWGGIHIMISDMRDMRITAQGIRYLHENGRMAKIGEGLKTAADIIAELASIAGLFA